MARICCLQLVGQLPLLLPVASFEFVRRSGPSPCVSRRVPVCVSLALPRSERALRLSCTAAAFGVRMATAMVSAESLSDRVVCRVASSLSLSLPLSLSHLCVLSALLSLASHRFACDVRSGPPHPTSSDSARDPLRVASRRVSSGERPRRFDSIRLDSIRSDSIGATCTCTRA